MRRKTKCYTIGIMTLIARKTILVVGDENATVHAIEDALIKAGATIVRGQCTTVTAASIQHQSIDLVLLNHLHDGMHCMPFLTTLRSTRLATVLPVLALVEDTPDAIEHALALGAADYFTPDETVPDILLKVRVALGETMSTADHSVLDISEAAHTAQRTVRVLVVEDDPLLINLLSMRMQRAGFLYEVNATGQDVLSSVATFNPDVILLDLTLPGVSGLTILQELSESGGGASIPVIIFSNRDSQDDKVQAMNYGAVRFYVKAMTDLSVLMQEIEELAAAHATL